MGNCNCKHGATGTATTCPECDILQLARNNYFTGKLLVERDFTDEQRYTMGKLRRHNQRLHGWGVVCGFKVKEHPNPACQSQYVVIEPGTAIDCCGREILLPCEEYFDFAAKFLANWQKQNGPASQPDTKAHTLQICVSYKECATENVPAIFDDCTGGAGSCQPNRILEGRSFDVLIDPASSIEDPEGVSLKWDFTVNIADVQRVAEDDSSNRLYVLTSTTTGSTSTAALYVYDTTNYTLLTSVTYTASAGLDVAVSPEGDFVYVAVQPDGTGAPQINVYSASNFTATVNQESVGTVNDSTVRMATYPGLEGSLFAFGTTAGVWDLNGMNASSGETSTDIASITNPVSIAVSEKNQYAYVATKGSATISVITLATSTLNTATIILPTAPSSLAIATTGNGETLAALDATGGNLYFVEIPTAGPASATVVSHTVTGFAYPPLQVLLSPGGRWAYVLEEDATTSNAYVQAVDEHAVKSGHGVAVGSAIAVGTGPLSETLSQDGKHLFIPYSNPASPDLGGVAIVDVSQTDCGDILKTGIDGCPDCNEGNCLVLATVRGYVYGSAITDSEIDNLKDRRLLISTDILTKAVQCLIDQERDSVQGPAGPAGTNGKNGATWYEGSGVPASSLGTSNDLYLNTANGDVYQNQSGTWVKIGNIQGPAGLAGTNGKNGATWYEGSGAPASSTGSNNDLYLNTANGDVYQMQSNSWVKVGNIEGPQGVAGNPGAGITKVNAQFVSCDVAGSASLSGTAPDLTLNLTIPGCCNTSLTGIASVSWGKNGNTVTAAELIKPGLVIAFDGYVVPGDLTANSIALLVPAGSLQLLYWEEVELTITPGTVAAAGNASSPFTAGVIASGPEAGYVDAVQLIPNSQLSADLTAIAKDFGGKPFHVVVKGDFIRDKQGMAIDGDHLPPWLPSRKTGDGIEGGTFESWFVFNAD
jgi:hypothetical protein